MDLDVLKYILPAVGMVLSGVIGFFGARIQLSSRISANKEELKEKIREERDGLFKEIRANEIRIHELELENRYKEKVLDEINNAIRLMLPHYYKSAKDE